MNYVTNGIEKYIKVTSNSDLINIDPSFDRYRFPVEMDGEFDSIFLSNFAQTFKEVEQLGFTNEIDTELSFLFELNKLRKLILHFYKGIKCDVDFARVAQLKELGMNWYFKYIKNLDAQKQLEHLSISDFTEKDFKRIPKFEKLKSFRSVGGKLKSFEHIDNISNIVALEISAHRGLIDIAEIQQCKNLKYLEINTCWKMADFTPIGELKELEVLHLIDCKNLSTIKFVEQMPKLRQLYTLGTTVINDYDTTPAENVPVFFGSLDNKYSKQYPEKEIMEGQKSWSSYLK